MSTLSAFDKVLDEVSDQGLNGFIQTLNTYERRAPVYSGYNLLERARDLGQEKRLYEQNANPSVRLRNGRLGFATRMTMQAKGN